MKFTPQIFTIPLMPMSRNARDRAHWSDRAQELNDWTLMIPMCAEKFRQGKTDPKRRVEIVFRKSRGPLQDRDNLYARVKTPLDAVVKRGWLYDDSPQYVDLIVREEISGKRGQTIIAVSEVKPKADTPPKAKPEGEFAERIARMEAELEELRAREAAVSDDRTGDERLADNLAERRKGLAA